MAKSQFSKRKNRILDVPSIKIYYQVIVIKTWHWHRNRKLNQVQNKKYRNRPKYI